MRLSPLVVASPSARAARSLKQMLEATCHRFEIEVVQAPGAESLSAWLESHLTSMPPDRLFETVALVDYGAWDDEPFSNPDICHLVLRFPEVLFLALVAKSRPSSSSSPSTLHHVVAWAALGDLFEALARHEGGFRSLFDPSGLRHSARLVLAGATKTKDVRRGRRRAAAIDDEPGFALMNGYILYRNGFETATITTASEFDRHFGSFDRGIADIEQPGSFHCLLEDLELSFPDRDNQQLIDQGFLPQPNGGGIGRMLACRQTRAHYRGATGGKRFIVSSRPLDQGGSTSGGFEGWVAKPHSGFFDPQLAFLRGWRNSNALRAAFSPTAARLGADHSAPGRMQTTATVLLARSRQVLRETRDFPSVKEAIYAAVLASEAMRALGRRVPGLSLEALALQQRAEVEAECCFLGTESGFDVHERLLHVDQLIGMILRKPSSLQSPARERQRANARIEVVAEIRRVFREFDKFDEEAQAIAAQRKSELLRSILRRRENFRKALDEITGGQSDEIAGRLAELSTLPERYFAWLLASGRQMSFAVAGWIVFFGCVYWLLNRSLGIAAAENSPLVSLMNSGFCFFTGWIETGPVAASTASGNSALVWFVRLSESALGFLHLGVLVSALFQKLARR